MSSDFTQNFPKKCNAIPFKVYPAGDPLFLTNRIQNSIQRLSNIWKFHGNIQKNVDKSVVIPIYQIKMMQFHHEPVQSNPSDPNAIAKFQTIRKQSTKFKGNPMNKQTIIDPI